VVYVLAIKLSISPGQYEFEPLNTNLCDMLRGQNRVDSLSEGEEGVVFLEKTNFYSEAGGQAGDIGLIRQVIISMFYLEVGI
jgi:alanyl-tRNA synthetase